MLKNLPQMQKETASKRGIQKTAEASGDFIRNGITEKTTRVSQQNNLETNEEEIPSERYIS